jgi:hypothetical protein
MTIFGLDEPGMSERHHDGRYDEPSLGDKLAADDLGGMTDRAAHAKEWCSTSKENAGHKFWVAHHGRYAIRIDANRPGVYRWLVTLESRTVRQGVAPTRDEAAEAVSEALDELPH